MLIPILLILLLLALLGGGIALHWLWIVFVVVLIVWLADYAMHGRRW